MDVHDLPLIDLHCHILPGVDDGCQSVEESLECVRQWSAAGYVGSVCTPHMGSSWFPEVTPQRVVAWLETLRAQVDQAGLNYRLWPGGELRLGEHAVAWMQTHGVPTIGPSRWVLVDYFGRQWPDCCDEGIDYLLDHGYEVLLAHPERLNMPEKEWRNTMDCLAGRGVKFQGNLNCVGGGEGATAQDRALRWLREDRYYVLASDTHGPDSVAGRLRGLDTVLQQLGADRVHELLSARPREILEGGA